MTSLLLYVEPLYLLCLPWSSQPNISIDKKKKELKRAMGIFPIQYNCGRPGGHSHWKGVWGCAAVMPPFSQASRRSLAYQLTVNVPLMSPLFLIFRKSLHFQPCFGQNSSSLVSNFHSQDPHFSRKIRSLDSTFWNPRGTHPLKKVECPPGVDNYQSITASTTLLACTCMTCTQVQARQKWGEIAQRNLT